MIFSLVLLLWSGFDLMTQIYSTTNLMVDTLPSDLRCRFTQDFITFRDFSSLPTNNGKMLEK
jgi:hypothetical protein